MVFSGLSKDDHHLTVIPAPGRGGRSDRPPSTAASLRVVRHDKESPELGTLITSKRSIREAAHLRPGKPAGQEEIPHGDTEILHA
jgi:hypothetical protein